MAYECIIYQQLEGGVVLVTLNRPQSLNALSNRLMQELWQVLDEMEKDREKRAPNFGQFRKNISGLGKRKSRFHAAH